MLTVSSSCCHSNMNTYFQMKWLYVFGVQVIWPIYLSVCLSVCLAVCLSVCLSVYLSIYLSFFIPRLISAAAGWMSTTFLVIN